MKARNVACMIRCSARIGFPLWLPLTLTLSPQAGRGDRAALIARALLNFYEC